MRMNVKRILCAVSVAASLAAQAAFDADAKSAVRKSAAELEAKLKAAPALNGRAITLLPVKGDEDGYCERLLIGAFVNAGKTCVVSNDDKKDERFVRILKEIAWDERQTTLKSIDPKTVDELGRLKSTQILVEARVDISRRGRKREAVAELDLLAYEIVTKQYVWTAHVAVDPSGRARPDPADFNVKVSSGGSKGAEGIAANVSAAVRDAVAGYGYRVNAEGKADFALTLAFTRETFDQSGGYFIFNGEAKARLASRTGDGILYEKTFAAKGRRGLGEKEAARNLAEELNGKLLKWLDETLAPRVLFAKHPGFANADGR